MTHIDEAKERFSKLMNFHAGESTEKALLYAGLYNLALAVEALAKDVRDVEQKVERVRRNQP